MSIFTPLVYLSCAILTGCSKSTPDAVSTTWEQGELTATLSVPYDAAHTLGTIKFQAQMKMDPLQKLFDPFEPKSEITTINQITGTSRVPVSRDTLRLLKHAVRFGQISDGAFDITTGPLSVLWGFSDGFIPSEPLPKSVRNAALRGVGYDKIEISESAVRLTSPYTQIDVSPLTTSYMLDIATLHLRNQKTPSMYLRVEESSRVLGEKAPGQPWTQSLTIPATQQTIGHIQFSDLPAAHIKAGSEEYVQIDGVQYYNNINPQTGMAVHYHQAVFTGAKSATKAAALAHALICHPLDEVQEIIFQFRECLAVLIPAGDDPDIYLSEGAEKMFVIHPDLLSKVRLLPSGETDVLEE